MQSFRALQPISPSRYGYLTGVGTAPATAQPCANASYRATHPAECNKTVPGGGWPKCGDLCAYPEYRAAMPHQCDGPVPEQLAARYLCAFTPYRHSPACAPQAGIGATTPPPQPVLGPAVCANPLPPGRYAITLTDRPVGSVRAFGLWADQFSDAVTVESKQALTTSDQNGLVAIFSVSKPVMWNPTVWGCPSVAGAAIKTPEDAQPALKPTASSNPLCALMPSFCGGAGGGIPSWVYLTVGAILVVALAPTLFEVSKVVAIREEHKA